MEKQVQEVQVHTSVTELDASEWNALAGAQPMLQHAFFLALEQGGCIGAATGWQPLYLALRRDGRLAGVMPLYLKSHSRGEFVFDQGWAHAFARHGLDYYPKLLGAVPFTPVSGRRLLAHTADDRLLLARAAIAMAQQRGLSSLHVNFAQEDDLAALRAAGCMLREGVQFHWSNHGYASLDDFLGCMTHDKRKKLRRESRRVQEAGIVFHHLRAADIGPAELDFFHHCYCMTYAQHGSAPYLSRSFFGHLHAAMPDTLLLIEASRDGVPLAAALNMLGDGVMYGRYWGATEFVSGLHFETCYTQSIAWCIAHGFSRFEGGAQGEHKLARGLLPTPTWSAHWIGDERFAEAIDDFLRRETQGVEQYLDELEAHAPFRRIRPAAQAPD